MKCKILGFGIALFASAALWGAQQTVNTGSAPNAGDGDPARTAFTKINANFTELYTQPYDLAFQNEGAPEDSAVLLRYVFPRAGTFVDDFVGSKAIAAVAATASTVFSIKKNGSTVGTITFAISGTTGTFVTSGGATSFAVNDVITVVGPATADITLANLAITLVGTRTL